MATMTQHRTRTPLDFTGTRMSLIAVPIGRFLFSLIFIISGINHFSSGSIGYAAGQGIPMADILVPISGVLAFLGGLSVLLGFHARFGALLLIIFLIPVTLLMHNFWSFTDPEMAQMQMVHFMKNICMLGGAVLIYFYGAGPISLDNRRARRIT
ncbi:DoxX family protein [Peredibacter starrii]|uniref:DoxX family protein n=1 Tax=Peredibacter starrii TaxID=28202 RepID=A0AAX4HR47_9BACT|nr:DoxX family protein [Peredibacter starrii]WPU65707.1 DoxX family protein [Peredibacter starrii]